MNKRVGDITYIVYQILYRKIDGKVNEPVIDTRNIDTEKVIDYFKKYHRSELLLAINNPGTEIYVADLGCEIKEVGFD